MTLPKLTGTDKQIPWAEEIRAAREDQFRALISCRPESKRDSLRKLKDQFFSKNTYAGFWINNRDKELIDLLQEMR